MTYTTSEIASLSGIHPNTVRFYEEMNLLPSIKREYNGYRVFTPLHLEQIKLLRTAFKSVLSKGSLKEIILEIIKLAAQGNFKEAERRSEIYLLRLVKLKSKAYEALNVAKENSFGSTYCNESYTKFEIMDMLDVSSESLRNWERSGLIQYPRKENGRIYYTTSELKRLSVISALREGGDSISEIQKMLAEIDNVQQMHYGSSSKTAIYANDDLLFSAIRIIKTVDEALDDYKAIRESITRLKKLTLQ